MSLLNQVINHGEQEAKMGQTLIFIFSGTMLLDVTLSLLGVVTPWIVIPLGIIELLAFFGIIYYLFGIIGNLFTLSRVGSLQQEYTETKYFSRG